MVFQIVDDLLDLTATEAQLGKPAGHDLEEGVYTLPVLRTLEAGGAPAEDARCSASPVGRRASPVPRTGASGDGLREAAEVGQAWANAPPTPVTCWRVPRTDALRRPLAPPARCRRPRRLSSERGRAVGGNRAASTPTWSWHTRLTATLTPVSTSVRGRSGGEGRGDRRACVAA
ncbi:MAG: polyprenyl synthetase family protein [Ilumatobacteraceae bacterium]